MTSAPGCRSIRPTSFRSLNVSWTMQLPCQSVIGRSSVLEIQRPRFLSGAKRISRSVGTEATILGALELVTMTSESAFTSAEQLM